MPLSNSTEHTHRNLCVIVEKWLEEHGYDRLFVRHGNARCGISTYERGGNPIDVGTVNDVSVYLFGDDDYSGTEISAHDKRFFDLLIESLKFAKP
jgi:hypothetical protein